MNQQRPPDRLQALFAEQCDFLIASAARFDEGHAHEWKRLAAALRVLLHDTPKSHSLLGQLGIKETLDFLDSDARREPESGMYPRGWPVGFVGVRLQLGNCGGASYVPMLDDDPEMPTGRVRFSEWWEKRLLDAPDSHEHWRRRDFVLGGANKEGGAHVDPAPDPAWTDLREGAWVAAAVTTGPNGSLVPIPALVPAVVRQIAHEVLTTLRVAGLVAEPAPALKGDPGVIIATASLAVPAQGSST
jgi:hypothetical protein